MKTILSSIGLLIVSLVGLYFIMYISINNKSVELTNLSTAQKGVIEANFDKMWKVISQQAQITEKAKESFKEMYIPLIQGRYANNDGLMLWIKEQNPEFKWELYERLMVSIESLRTEFFNEQKKMLSIINQYDNLRAMFPGKWFVGDLPDIKYEIISSTNAKNVMNTRIDDSIELFE